MTREEHEVLDYFYRRDDETFTGEEVYSFLKGVFSDYYPDADALELAINRLDYFMRNDRGDYNE